MMFKIKKLGNIGLHHLDTSSCYDWIQWWNNLFIISRFLQARNVKPPYRRWTLAPSVKGTPTSSRATTTASMSWKAAWPITSRSRSSGTILLVSQLMPFESKFLSQSQFQYIPCLNSILRTNLFIKTGFFKQIGSYFICQYFVLGKISNDLLNQKFQSPWINIKYKQII